MLIGMTSVYRHILIRHWAVRFVSRWNAKDHVIDEEMPKVLSDVMPVIQFVPMLKKEIKDRNEYLSPIYKTRYEIKFGC